jgi:hypothetical protein
MSYRDHIYNSPTGTHPVGDHSTSGQSAWGLAVVLVVLLGLLGLAMMAGPADQRGDQADQGTAAPAIEQQASPNMAQPAPAQTAPVQPVD